MACVHDQNQNSVAAGSLLAQMTAQHIIHFQEEKHFLNIFVPAL